MQDGSEFKIVSEDKHHVYGYYVDKEHIGICPLIKERLINDLNPEPDIEIETWREVLYIVGHYTESNSTMTTFFMPCVRFLIKHFSIKKKTKDKITPLTLNKNEINTHTS